LHFKKIVPKPEVPASITSGVRADTLKFILYYLDVTEPIKLLQWLQNIPVNKILLATSRTPHKLELIMMFASGKNQRNVYGFIQHRITNCPRHKKTEGPIAIVYNIK
jgi:hypothetical protein